MSTRIATVVFPVGLWSILFTVSIYFILGISAGRINSDAAAYYVLSQEILRAGVPLPADWTYANGDLMLFTKPLIITVLDFLGVTGLIAFKVSGIVLLCAASFMTFTVVRSMEAGTPAALVGASIPLAPFSEIYMVHANVTGFYLTWYVHILVVVYLARLLLYAPPGSRVVPVAGLALAAVLFMLTVENPVRVLFYVFVPVIATCVLARHFSSIRFDRTLRMRAIAVGSVGFAVTLCAIALYESLDFRNVESAIAVEIVALGDIPGNLLSTMYGLTVLAGSTWKPGESLLAMDAAVSVARSCLYATALALPVYCALRRRNDIPACRLLLIVFSFAGMTAIGGIYSLTSLQIGGVDVIPQTMRYLLPFFLLTLVCNVLVWHYQSRMARSVLCLALIVVVLTVTPSLASTKAERRLTEMQAVINVLRREHVSTTYAPYWHSHGFTLLSSGEVPVRPVLANGHLEMFPILRSARWYDAGHARGRTAFLFLREDDPNAWAHLSGSCYGTPDKIVATGAYDVFLYEENPALRVFAGLLSNETGRICLTDRSYRHIGTHDARRSAIVATAQEGQGFLHFGPYESLSCGRYATTFVVSAGPASETTNDFGFVDVTHRAGREVLGRHPISPGVNRIEIEFDVPADGVEDIEFRVFSTGAASMVLNAVTLDRDHRCATTRSARF